MKEQQFIAAQKKKARIRKNIQNILRKLVHQKECYAKDATLLDQIIEQVEHEQLEDKIKSDAIDMAQIAEELFSIVMEKYKFKKHEEKLKYRPFVNEKIQHMFHFASTSTAPQENAKPLAAIKKRERMVEYTNKLKEVKQRKLHLHLAPLQQHELEQVEETNHSEISTPKSFRNFEDLNYLQNVTEEEQDSLPPSPHFSPTKEAIVNEALKQADSDTRLDNILSTELITPKAHGKAFSKQLDDMYAKIMRDADIVQEEILSFDNHQQLFDTTLQPPDRVLVTQQLEDTINFDSQFEKLENFNPYPNYSPRYYMAKDSATRNFVHELHSAYSRSVVVGHVLPFVKPLYFSPQVERDKFRKELNYYNHPLLSPISTRSPIVQNQRQKLLPNYSFSYVPHLPPILKEKK